MNEELQTLRNALVALDAILAPGVQIPRYNTEDHDLAVIATGIFRKAFIQANVVATAATTDHPEGAVPNLRSMLEGFGELHFLLTSSDRRRQAQIAFVYALRELRDFCKELGELEDLAKVDSELAQRKDSIPEAYAEAMNRRNYWTPIGRAKLVETAIATLIEKGGKKSEGTGKCLYKLLSWDEHHVMAALLAIQVNPNLPDLGTIKKQDAPENPETFLPFMASGVLAAMLGLYLEAFPELRTKLGLVNALGDRLGRSGFATP